MLCVLQYLAIKEFVFLDHAALQRCALIFRYLAPFPAMHLPVLSLLLSSVGLASAQYTVYQPQQQVIFGGNTNSSIQGLTTASAAYDPTLLQAPTPPDPPVPTNQFVQLYSGGMDDLSMPLSGAFFGFSIEMSIATRVRMYLPVPPTFFPPILVCFRSGKK
jgi:hypothetical protein